MPQKIFISYRRQDAGANALGIGQYLEHQFGRKSVFIDVDMRAGARFPQVLEQRLAECKVMLVLIGPEWLNSRDEQGRRRLDSSDDWVRLEIAHALRRNITVIPVRVNGAELPERAALPDDIKGLLDHQAVSITIAGFRNEMSGLVRDIRAIPSTRSWRRFSAIGLGVAALLAALVVFLFSNYQTSQDAFPLRPSPLTKVSYGQALQANGCFTGPTKTSAITSSADHLKSQEIPPRLSLGFHTNRRARLAQEPIKTIR